MVLFLGADFVKGRIPIMYYKKKLGHFNDKNSGESEVLFSCFIVGS